jgi:choline-glycine betaine transporter
MTALSVAMAVALITAGGIVLRWPMYKCMGDTPLPTASFLAILFTSGLDVGLLMFPLIDFEVYASEPDYAFASPLVIEFGFWAGLVWSFYFLTTMYFCAIEPRLKLFELGPIRWIHNGVVIATCAFTAYLFLIYLPSYIEGIDAWLTYVIVGAVIVLAVLSSTRLSVLRVLSLGSSSLFFLLVLVGWCASNVCVARVGGQMGGLAGIAAHNRRVIFTLHKNHSL